MPPTFAVGRYTAAALRSRPREDAPLESQLLLGEPVEVLEREGDYVRVRLPEEKQEGYLRYAQLQAVERATYLSQLTAPTFALELFQLMVCGDYGLPVTAGARLPLFDGLQARHDGRRFTYSGQIIDPAGVATDAGLLTRLALRWLYVPQLAGGRTPTGVDGLHLIRLLYRLLGHCLPAGIGGMVDGGRPVDFVEQCQEGDVAFFDGAPGRLNHLGIVLPDSRLLHVAGRVRTDAVDHYGIFDYDRRQYTHRLRVVRRYLPDEPAARVALVPDRSAIRPDAKQMLFF